MNKNIN